MGEQQEARAQEEQAQQQPRVELHRQLRQGRRVGAAAHQRHARELALLALPRGVERIGKLLAQTEEPRQPVHRRPGRRRRLGVQALLGVCSQRAELGAQQAARALPQLAPQLQRQAPGLLIEGAAAERRATAGPARAARPGSAPI